MANIKSAQKRAKQNVVRRKRNVSRNSAVKTAVKKVLTAIENSEDSVATLELLRSAEAQIARAKGKGLIHPNTAARKISRLAKRVATAAE